MDDSQLRQAWANRQGRESIFPLAQALEHLVHKKLARQVKKVGQLSAVLDEVLPGFILEHAALVSYNRGSVTLAVDSAPYRYQLDLLLKNGLLAAIRERFAGPINRVRVVPGNFDSLEFPAEGADA